MSLCSCLLDRWEKEKPCWVLPEALAAAVPYGREHWSDPFSFCSFVSWENLLRYVGAANAGAAESTSLGQLRKVLLFVFFQVILFRFESAVRLIVQYLKQLYQHQGFEREGRRFPWEKYPSSSALSVWEQIQAAPDPLLSYKCKFFVQKCHCD